MGIYINEQENFFSLRTNNTEYQMQADEYGVLKHIWYGERVENNMSYLLEYPDVGFSGNPYDAGNDRTYSLNTLPLEYACSGIGDFRIPAVSVKHSDGSRASDLRYKSFKIKKGKYNITGMPAVYGDESDFETLEIILYDTSGKIEITLRYGVLEKYDIITRSAVIRNLGQESVILEKAASLCLDIPHFEWELIHFHGRHAMERLSQRSPLINGIQEIASTRGTSSHQHNPSFILCSPDCTENSGECIGSFFVYSGSFQAQAERDELGQIRAVMGIHPELFSWNLKPGDIFETPEAVLTYSKNGFSKLSYNFHKVIREHICRGKYKLAERPVLINNWEATYFDFNSDKILEIAKESAELGVDMLVLDDGWFGKRDNDCSGLGDWFFNEK